MMMRNQKKIRIFAPLKKRNPFFNFFPDNTLIKFHV